MKHNNQILQPELHTTIMACPRCGSLNAALDYPCWNCGLTSGCIPFYIASKVKHAERWQKLRASGVLIVSTWIDEAGEDQTEDYAELACRCIGEISICGAVLLYCEPGEILKGALIEVGAALALGKEVRCVGACDSISRVFKKHPRWIEYPSVSAAVSTKG